MEFRLGDHQDELGLIDRRYAPPDAAAGPPLTEREAGFVTAAVVDPFGNVLGLMHSPHWLAQLPSAGVER